MLFSRKIAIPEKDMAIGTLQFLKHPYMTHGSPTIDALKPHAIGGECFLLCKFREFTSKYPEKISLTIRKDTDPEKDTLTENGVDFSVCGRQKIASADIDSIRYRMKEAE